MTRVEPTIRRATPADIVEVARLGVELVRQHHAYDPRRYTLFEPLASRLADFYRDQLARPDALILVAEDGAGVAGFAFARVEAAEIISMMAGVGWVHDLYVEQPARGHGLGSRLLDAAIDGLRLLGSASVMLGVAPQNEPARRLFLRRGFRYTLQEMRLD
jgi:GNAT superfamily N-acetyltransferase